MSLDRSRTSGRSLIKRENRRGPSTLPWGEPSRDPVPGAHIAFDIYDRLVTVNEIAM